MTDALLDGSFLYHRSGINAFFRPALGDAAAVRARSSGALFAVLADAQRAGGNTPVSQVFDSWHSLLFGKQEVPALTRFPAPWHWITDASELVEVDVAYSSQLIVFQAAVVGYVELPWFDREGLSIVQSIARTLGSEATTSSETAIGVVDNLIEALISESLERSLDELIGLSDSLNFDSTTERLDLVRLRVRQLHARRIFAQSLRAQQRWVAVLEAGERNLEVLSQALNLGQLRLLAAKAAEADAAHQADAKQRSADEASRAAAQRRTDRRFSIWAAILILPSLWFGYLGVSQSPPSLAGVTIATRSGQSLVIIIAILLALVGFGATILVNRRK